MNPIILAVIGVLIPFAAGFLATEIAKGALWVNALPAPLPQVIGVVVTFLLAALANFLGFSLPADLGGLNQDVIAAILTALAQMLFPVTTALAAARARKGLK